MYLHSQDPTPTRILPRFLLFTLLVGFPIFEQLNIQMDNTVAVFGKLLNLEYFEMR